MVSRGLRSRCQHAGPFWLLQGTVHSLPVSASRGAYVLAFPGSFLHPHSIASDLCFRHHISLLKDPVTTEPTP